MMITSMLRLAVPATALVIAISSLQAHASPSNSVTISNSEKLMQEANAACKRTFGPTASVRRIDRTLKYIYCADSNNDNDVLRIKFRFGTSKPRKPQIRVSPDPSMSATGSPTGKTDGSVACSDQPGGVCAAIPPIETEGAPSVTTPSATEQSGRLQKGALQFCVSRYGPASTVKHIDYEKWEVVCNIP